MWQCAKESGYSQLHPGILSGMMWCHGYHQKMMECQQKGIGCWYYLMCSSKDVDPAWKNVFCGGKTEELEVRRRRRDYHNSRDYLPVSLLEQVNGNVTGDKEDDEKKDLRA